MPKIIFRPPYSAPPFVPPVPVAGPLTFTAREANSSVAFNINGSVPGVSFSYSTDNGQTWNPYTFGQSINLAAVNDNVMFKGDNNSFSVDDGNFIQANMTGKIAASGSLAYLLDSNGNNKALTPYCFNNMFNECASLVQAPALPATTLAEYCYEYMFSSCTSLEQAPALPATSLKDSCYLSMFENCTSLVQAPALPATLLANECYNNMFSGCTSLEQAPALPATSLAKYCYEYMFSGCTSLNYVQCNATDISADGCLENWLESVSDTGTFKKNPLMDDWPEGESGIPYDWVVEDI